MKNKEKFLEAFLNDHFHNHRSIDSVFYEKVFLMKEFVFEGESYRGCICTEEFFSPYLNREKYKSWTKSISGLKNFVKNDFIDGGFLNEQDKETFKIEKGYIIGIDISKIILFLKERGYNEDYFSHLLSEDEVILIEFIKNLECNSLSILESEISSFFRGEIKAL